MPAATIEEDMSNYSPNYDHEEPGIFVRQEPARRSSGRSILADQANVARSIVHKARPRHVYSGAYIVEGQQACAACKNANSVAFSEPFGLFLCHLCLRFITLTKELKLKYRCLAGGGCDITWASNKILCSSCRFEAIIMNPDFVIESFLEPADDEGTGGESSL